jgi:hypothetical protein
MTSRLMEVMMGMSVTVQINPQAKIEYPYCAVGLGVRKIGTKLA